MIHNLLVTFPVMLGYLTLLFCFVGLVTLWIWWQDRRRDRRVARMKRTPWPHFDKPDGIQPGETVYLRWTDSNGEHEKKWVHQPDPFLWADEAIQLANDERTTP